MSVMKIDEHEFLTEVITRVATLPGDPADEIESAVAAVVATHTIELLKIARAHRDQMVRVAARLRGGTDIPPRWRH